MVDLIGTNQSLEKLWCRALNGGSRTVSCVAGKAALEVAVFSTQGTDVVCHWSVSLASGLPSSCCLTLCLSLQCQCLFQLHQRVIKPNLSPCVVVAILLVVVRDIGSDGSSSDVKG